MTVSRAPGRHVSFACQSARSPMSFASAFPSRNVSFVGPSAGSTVPFASFFPAKWGNYAVVVWAPKNPLMLRLELHESWSDENFVLFKRVPCGAVGELQRRKIGITDWPDSAIVGQGIDIVGRGPPYASKRWHVFWPDHQSFVEELASAIIKPAPRKTPPRLKIYRGPDALKKWDRISPIAVQLKKSGSDPISDNWTDGTGMLCAYPGGPGRIRKA